MKKFIGSFLIALALAANAMPAAGELQDDAPADQCSTSDSEQKAISFNTFLNAAFTGDEILFEYLDRYDKYGIGVNQASNYGCIALHYAANSQHTTYDFIRRLIERGASKDIEDPSVGNAHSIAKRSGRPQEIIDLLKPNKTRPDVPTAVSYSRSQELHNLRRNLVLNPKIDMQALKTCFAHISGKALTDGFQEGRNPLHWAAFRGDHECIKFLIERGIGINAPTAPGWTRLHLALQDVRLIPNPRELVIAEEPTASALLTALHIAAEQGHVACVRLLLDKGADMKAKNFEGVMPFHVAAQTGSVECAQAFLDDFCFDPKTPAENGKTALHFAAECRQAEFITWLVNEEKDEPEFHHLLSAKDDQGLMAYQIAERSKFPQYIIALLNPNKPSSSASSSSESFGQNEELLFEYVAHNISSVLTKLLKRHVNINIRNGEDHTALHVAASIKDNESCIELLIMNRANKELTTPDGETAYDIAKRVGRPEKILKLLMPASRKRATVEQPSTSSLIPSSKAYRGASSLKHQRK